MSKSLNDAIRALETAVAELNEYAKSGDPILLRDTAEKGWLAVSKAVEALLRARGIDARTYRERRDTLSRLGLDYLRDRYAAKEKFLHIDCFYDGLYDEDFVRRKLDKVREIIDEIRELIPRQ
ncbi:hypothetical protein [Vulcanisaeta distributa]|uniref:PaREP1 family protein n=1 Tax=Vulcanisaeta distributa (strain DSM 14429 / JCM 11212 / NBRC 100878 / IC-017) TaxID=572478 RepID=E1QPF2_VULDI|nr:hypothetical protein [Vulcanisaeta distributa]ADN51440.1 conserved hypothetical protein [Vulcanisaeta distributa DSM 14429]